MTFSRFPKQTVVAGVHYRNLMIPETEFSVTFSPIEKNVQRWLFAKKSRQSTTSFTGTWAWLAHFSFGATNHVAHLLQRKKIGKCRSFFFFKSCVLLNKNYLLVKNLDLSMESKGFPLIKLMEIQSGTHFLWFFSTMILTVVFFPYWFQLFNPSMFFAFHDCFDLLISFQFKFEWLSS